MKQGGSSKPTNNWSKITSNSGTFAIKNVIVLMEIRREKFLRTGKLKPTAEAKDNLQAHQVQ
jgi:hypothetical protein